MSKNGKKRENCDKGNEKSFKLIGIKIIWISAWIPRNKFSTIDFSLYFFAICIQSVLMNSIANSMQIKRKLIKKSFKEKITKKKPERKLGISNTKNIEWKSSPSNQRMNFKRKLVECIFYFASIHWHQLPIPLQ